MHAELLIRTSPAPRRRASAEECRVAVFSSFAELTFLLADAELVDVQRHSWSIGIEGDEMCIGAGEIWEMGFI